MIAVSKSTDTQSVKNIVSIAAIAQKYVFWLFPSQLHCISVIVKCIAKIQLFGNIRKQKLMKNKTIFYSKKVKDTTATTWGTITINPWPNTIVEGYFDFTIPTITGDSTDTEFEG